MFIVDKQVMFLQAKSHLYCNPYLTSNFISKANNQSELKHKSSVQLIQRLVSGHDSDRVSSTPHPPSSSRQSQNQTAVLNICLSFLILMMEAAAAGFSDTQATLYQSTNCNTLQVFIPYSFSK
jgi:hypothetical protein